MNTREEPALQSKVAVKFEIDLNYPDSDFLDSRVLRTLAAQPSNDTVNDWVENVSR